MELHRPVCTQKALEWSAIDRGMRHVAGLRQHNFAAAWLVMEPTEICQQAIQPDWAAFDPKVVTECVALQALRVVLFVVAAAEERQVARGLGIRQFGGFISIREPLDDVPGIEVGPSAVDTRKNKNPCCKSCL